VLLITFELKKYINPIGLLLIVSGDVVRKILLIYVLKNAQVCVKQTVRVLKVGIKPK